MPIDTRKVRNRRKLRFETLDQVLADVEQLARLEQAGRLQTLGNWSLGQTINHLATWVEFAYAPPDLPRPPLPIRLILRLMRILNTAMPVGVWIRGVENGTLGTEPASIDRATARYVTALERLRRESPTAQSAAFGPMTHEEAIKLNLRHAELHLSFLIEAPAAP